MSTRDIKFQKQNRRIPYISRLLRFWYCLYTQVIAALEVVHTDFGVIVVATITVGVDGGDGAIRSVRDNRTNAPSVIGITRNSFNVLIENRYNVTLQIFLEIERLIVVHDTADAVLVVIQRDNGVVVPFFAEDFGAVEGVNMIHTVNSLARADAVGVVGIAVAVERFQLPTLFPCQCVTEIRSRVALRVVGNRLG